VLAATLLVASTTVASAHDYGYGTSGIDARRAWEQRRINYGLRSGQLTWREYRYLEREQARIGRDERRAKADGYVSPSERYRLNRELDQASRDIHRLKHSDRVAWSPFHEARHFVQQRRPEMHGAQIHNM
jgi:hypothetical protein